MIPFFRPRPLKNLLPIDECESLAPITHMQACRSKLSERIHHSADALTACTFGLGRSSMWCKDVDR